MVSTIFRMAKSVSKSKFKPRALEFFREVETTGRELIVTDRGKPVLKIVPYREDPLAPLEGLRGTLVKYDDPLEPVAAEDWESNR
jgi:prevent-host-death family protein